MSILLKAGVILASGVVSGLLVGFIGGRALFIIPGVIAILVLGMMVLTKPYIGVIITIAALPLESLYTDVGFGASLMSFVGLITLFAYLVNRRFAINSRVGFAWIYRFGVLFILWFLVTNPFARV